jgi:ABC-type glycerol-3-phosphate transport system substrate-binding protein
VSFAAWDFERAGYEALAKKFNAENPGIQVVVVPLDDFINMSSSAGPDNPLSTLRRVVSNADTAPAAFVPPEAYGTPLLLDLKPLMDADAGFKRDDFYPGAIERATAKGGSWVLPRFLDVQLLSLNKELLAGKSIPEPKPDWTWQTVLAIAEQVAEQRGSRVETYGVLDPSGGLMTLTVLLQERGIDLFTLTGKDLRVDGPDFVAAYTRLRALVENGAVLLPGYGSDAPVSDPSELVKTGRLAIWPAGYIGPQGGPDDKPPFAVVQLPYPPANPYFTGGYIDGFIISGGTAAPNESWRWIEFLSRQPPIQPTGRFEPIGDNPGRIPARRSLADQLGVWSKLDAATAEAYRQAIAQSGVAPTATPEYIAINALQEVLYRSLGDKRATPEQVLGDAQRQIEEQFAQAQLTPTAVPDVSPVIVAPPEPQEAPAGATGFTFGGFGYNATELRRLARTFREQRPDLFATIKMTDTYTGTYELSEIARTYDCFAWFQRPGSDADRQALLDLQPLFDADAAFSQSDYPPALLEPYRRNGALYGLPATVYLRGLSYNRSAFESAGVRLPSYEWKPGDFLAAAQALTSGEGDRKRYGYVPLSRDGELFFFIGQFGGKLTTGAGKDLRVNFTDPKVVEAIKWYLDLDGVHKVTPPIFFAYKRDVPPPPDNGYELVQNGRASMWFDQGGIIQPAEGLADPFTVGVAPLPIGQGGLTGGDFSGLAFFISATAANPQACWDWIKFLSGDTRQLQSLGGIPARASVATSEEFARVAAPEQIALYNVYTEALKRPGTGGNDPGEFYSNNVDPYWLYKAIDEYRTKNIDLARGLADAQEKTNAFLECIAKDGKPPACALQVDPTYEGFNSEAPPEGKPPQG